MGSQATSVGCRQIGARLCIAAGLSAGLCLHARAEDPAEATSGSPQLEAPQPQPTITYNEDVTISKLLPTFTLRNATSSAARGLQVSLNSLEDSLSWGFLVGAAPVALYSYTYDAATAGKMLFSRPSNFTRGLGVGVYPTESLHVRGADGRTRLLLEEQSPVVAGRNLLRLANNGPATFRFDNLASGASWGFGAIADQDKFFITRAGAPGLGLTLDGSGNVTIAGSLTQLSDRGAKHDVQPVDGATLLAKVDALPLSTWTYNADVRGERHMGPMAQDFAAAFGLGADDRHVAPLDVAGVSLVGVQALKRENDRLKEALEELSGRLAVLERRTSQER